MPNRIISENICTSDSLSRLGWFEQAVFFRLIVLADDYGCYDARPQIIRGKGFPLYTVTDKQISDALYKLGTVGMVSLYMVDGKPYLQLEGWQTYQRVRNSKHRFPTKNDANDISPQVAASCGELPQVAALIQSNPNPIQSLSESESNTAQALAVPYDQVKEAYNRFCPNMPKCTMLSEARKKAIKARFSSGASLDDFEKLFQMAGESEFLNGKNDRNWMANFDWLIKDGNMAKVLSGNYGASKSRNPVQRHDDELTDYEREAIARLMEGDGKF